LKVARLDATFLTKKEEAMNTAVKVVEELAIEKFQANLRGEVLRPGQDGYDTARKVFNAMIDKRPGLIVRCSGAADVIQCVNFAREQELPVSVRGGGHSVAGKAVCEGGLMIDFSRMKGIRVDPARRTAQAQAGLTGGEFDRETQAFGLATTLGIVSTTGIAGLTLGGGKGWLHGKYGMACDNLLSADVVTADGRLLTASATENEDLFWGLRGGGGNFGVVTSFKYRLYAVGPVLGGVVLYPIEKATEVLRLYRDCTTNPPDEFRADAALLTAPDGNFVAGIAACYCGSLREGDEVVKPLRQFGPPLADLLRPTPYVEQQKLLDAFFPFGKHHHYWKTTFLRELSDDALETIAHYGRKRPSSACMTALEPTQGAATRVDPRESAFPHRSPAYELLILALWEQPAQKESHLRWVQEFWDAIVPFSGGGVYVNYLSEGEGADRVRAAYGANYNRLAAIKKKYDPSNFFRLNQNIPPAA
jgi:FAD/FMN-containing dehydrogenase